MIVGKIEQLINLGERVSVESKNLFRYCKEYFGQDPKLLEEDIFKFILPVTPQATMQATMQDERLKAILNFCKEPRSREEIQKRMAIL